MKAAAEIYPADVFPEHEESVPAKMMLGRLAGTHVPSAYHSLW
jgi:hypothetical protein